MRAAERLSLTQPALTHSLRKLESLLGTALVQRSGRRVVLTQAGERLVKAAHQVLPRLEKAEEDVRRMARGDLLVLRIGVECHPCYQWLLGVIERYLQLGGREVEISRKFQFAAIEALLNHHVDVVVTPDAYASAALEWVAVLDYELVAVMRDSHPLAHRKFLQPADFAEETLLTYPVEETRLDVFTRFLLPSAIRPKRVRHEETHELMIVLARQGRGVAVLPDWLVGTSMPGVRVVRLGPKGLAKQLLLGYRKENKDDPALGRFLEIAANKEFP